MFFLKQIPGAATAPLVAFAVLGTQSLHAANINQSANSASGSNWNQGSLWTGGAAPSAGNDYFTVSSGTLTNIFTTNGKTWSFGNTIGTMRTPNATSAFGGNSLTLANNTRLLGKTENGGTSTANLVFGGGFYMDGPNAGGSATLAGTISFASGIDLGAIAVNANAAGAFTQTVNSAVIGDVSDTLQLTLLTENGALRLGHLVFTGDLNGFGGTLYVGTANSGSATGSTYSIRSSSALTTLNIATNTFGNAGGSATYNLATSESFGSLIVGGTTLGLGTYNATDLNAIAGGSFFTGAGTLTVVPEPATVAAGAVGLLAFVAAARRRRSSIARR